MSAELFRKLLSPLPSEGQSIQVDADVSDITGDAYALPASREGLTLLNTIFADIRRRYPGRPWHDERPSEEEIGELAQSLFQQATTTNTPAVFHPERHLLSMPGTTTTPDALLERLNKETLSLSMSLLDTTSQGSWDQESIV